MLLYEESMIITIMTMTKGYIIHLLGAGICVNTLYILFHYFGTYPNNAVLLRGI